MKKNYQITDIQVKNNNINRVKLFIDHQLFMEVDDNTAKDLDLYIGKTVSDQLIDMIQQRESLSKAKNDAIRFLTARPRSEWEMVKKLRDKEYKPDIVDVTVDWLKEKNLINDQEFSLMWIKDRLNNKPSGILKLRKELYNKGIDSEIIESAIHSYFKTDEDEMLLAQQLIKSKKYSLQSKDIELESRKVINLLKSRGFSYQTINVIYHKFFDD